MAEIHQNTGLGVDLDALQADLIASSPSRRISRLQELSGRFSYCESLEAELTPIIKLLFETHPLYRDRQSRQAVRDCLRTLFSVDGASQHCSQFVELLKAEAAKTRIAATNAFVLVEWSSLLLQISSSSAGRWEKWGQCLLVANAQALESCLGSDIRPSVKHSSVAVTSRALRRVLTTQGDTQLAVKRIVSTLTSGSRDAPSVRNAVLLGVFAKVCAGYPAARSVFADVKPDCYRFYVQEVVGSRALVPLHVATALKDFFCLYSTEDDLKMEVMPAVEKALLRTPELMLHGVVQCLLQSIPNDVDLSEILRTNLLKPLLSNIKSTNIEIREGAVLAFQLAAGCCREQCTVESIIDEILNPMKSMKVSSAEQRALLSQMLAAVPPSVASATKIPVGLAQVASREANEVSLSAESNAIRVHLSLGFSSSLQPDKLVTEAFTKGLVEKRPSVRKIWIMRAGEVLLPLTLAELQSTLVLPFLLALLPHLETAWAEVGANPLSAAQSGIIIAGYIVIAIFQQRLSGASNEALKKAAQGANVVEQALTSDPKRSFLLNHRIYTKFTSEDDLTWFLHAVTSVVGDVVKEHTPHAVKDSWAQAFLYLITGSNAIRSVRDRARKALTTAYLDQPAQVSKVLLGGLWTWYHHITQSEKDTAAIAAKSELDRLYLVIQSICLPPSLIDKLGRNIDHDVLEDQLVDLVVICRPEILPRTSWIASCQRTGLDPGELARKHSTRLLNNIISITEEKDSVAKLKAAAYKAAAELAFVSPDVFTSLLVQQIKDDLDPTQLEHIGPTEVAIFRTPEGTPFIDVLNSKSQTQVPDKNAKDYDTLKWEQELREQLAHKRGNQKKLTNEEQARVDAQLAKESSIRRELKKIEIKVRRGIGIIQSLASGPPTEAEEWMGPATSSLLAAISQGVGLLVGSAATDAYLACSEQVTSRLATLRRAIGSATLRSLGAPQVLTQLDEEPLGHQITRVLYRLRFTAEQRAFDTVSMLYILPLIFNVLGNDRTGKTAAEDADVQIVLVLEFLSFQTDLFTDRRLPRSTTLSKLILSMGNYPQHHKLFKDCLADLCRSIASNITNEELRILLKSAIAPDVSVRHASLQAINAELDLVEFDFLEEIWLACHDEVEEHADLGREIWAENALDVNNEAAAVLLPYLEREDPQLRGAAARAIAEAVRLHPSCFSFVVAALEDLYRAKAVPLISEYDKLGRLTGADKKDPWEGRSGTALAAKELSGIFQPSHVGSFLRFLVNEGALSDRNGTVRNQMVEAATSIIAKAGRSQVEELMQAFESTLEAPDNKSQSQDLVKEAVIILYGALAQHLHSGDERIPKVVQRLLAATSTPSETIQYAVAECLPPLVRTSRQHVSEYIQQAMDGLLQSKTFASRRGAAYALAGIIQGTGISALREYRILSTLQTAMENKKNSNHRQGALFAYELMSLFLGKAFEPYTIIIVPQLLLGFGDGDADVRETCLDAAKTCFASLTSYGVKKILPTLLDGLGEQRWRSKKGACDLLGAMAYLDPQQLALSLPEIIPPLTNVLNDSHKDVRASANRSLQRFGEVISNPEIKSLVGVLLKAISDPTKYTDDALDALMKMSFKHYLDAPSLALIVRILERGLGDRSATRRKSAQIIGSLAHLTERKDLLTHLPILVSGLRLAVVDPVPATRATASKALGSLIEKLGEEALPDLIPSLMATLKAETGAGDRLGSAQALSEVLAGLGTMRLEETLPTILQNASSSRPMVREGFLSLFIYLPACFGNSFATYLSKVIPSILAGLADEVESIRQTALRAGRLLVKNFANRAVDLLLPELERGLADDSYRIRLSSVELVGTLLFTLTGTSSNAEQEELEDISGQAAQSLREIIGEEKRNRIFSALYICRCDTSGIVRTEAIKVWKAIVPSPRILKEIVPTLTQLLVRRLASSSMEQKVIASNALGELIRKAGEGVLSTLLPMLEEELQISTDSDAKQGVCIALRELITAATPESLQEYEKMLISIVRTALVDSNEEVREVAAEAFDSLQRLFGKRAVDQVLPYLLNLLREQAEADHALSALLTLLTDNARSNMILPNLLPTLLTSPISAFNAKALASLSQVAGASISRRIPNILNALMDNIITCKDDHLQEELTASFDAVLLSVDEFDGLNSTMNTMLTLAKHSDHLRRGAANLRLASFISKSDIDFSRYYQDLIRVFLISFDDRDQDVITAAWTALSALTSRLRKEEMESLVISTRQVLQGVGVPGSSLPGFSLPKGINAILPIFLQGLMNGTSEQRVQSALGISDIVDRTNGDSLKPSVTQITGPLIRVVSERSTDVKAAILLALNNLLEKIPTFLKPFLPQLQRTFAKCLADTSSEVLRARAAKALGTLIKLTPRVDPLISELVTGSKTEDTGVKKAMLKALYEVISRAGANMSEVSRAAVLSLLETTFDDAEDEILIAKARLLGTLTKNLPPTEAKALLRSRVLKPQISKVSILCLNSVLVESSNSLLESHSSDTAGIICQGIGNNNMFISCNSVLAAGKYLLIETTTRIAEAVKVVLEALASVVPAGNATDNRRLALVVIRTVSRLHPQLIEPYYSLLAPPIFASVRDPIIPVKLSAEAAFLALFSVVEREGASFEEYMAGAGSSLAPTTKRSMQDYFKRVALRLGAQARERREAEGGQGGLGLSSDEREDEEEVWSVGKVDLGDGPFGDE